MAIFISTNMYHADEFPQVLDYVNAFDRQVGVEVFPLFHDPRFYGILEGCLPDLKDQILADHLHNNDGVHDSHQRIHNGSLDFDRFLDLRNDLAVRTGIDTDLVLEYAHDVIPDRRGI